MKHTVRYMSCLEMKLSLINKSSLPVFRSLLTDPSKYLTVLKCSNSTYYNVSWKQVILKCSLNCSQSNPAHLAKH